MNRNEEFPPIRPWCSRVTNSKAEKTHVTFQCEEDLHRAFKIEALKRGRTMRELFEYYMEAYVTWSTAPLAEDCDD